MPDIPPTLDLPKQVMHEGIQPPARDRLAATCVVAITELPEQQRLRQASIRVDRWGRDQRPRWPMAGEGIEPLLPQPRAVEREH